MATLEEGGNTDAIRDAIVHLEERMDRRFEAIDLRFDGIERRIDGFDDKLSRYFVWMVGLQVTTLAAIVAALAVR